MTGNLFIAVQALGGLGLFLLGMIIMTDGLREMAGDAIRSVLIRFTSSIANGRLDIPDATDCLEAIRWLDRVSYHVNRIALHIQQAVLASGK